MTNKITLTKHWLSDFFFSRLRFYISPGFAVCFAFMIINCDFKIKFTDTKVRGFT